MKIFYSKQVTKYLDKCDTKTYGRLVASIEGLLEGKGDIAKLQGRQDSAYRLKKPPYRIIFRINAKQDEIYIDSIYPRGDAYKKG